MLRETRARFLTFATASVVVALAALFAWLRNPPADGVAPAAVPSPGAGVDAVTPATPRATIPAARLAAGQAAFVRLNCSRCHAIAGVGNPSNPLDGVGGRLDTEALRDWTLGTGPASDQLPAGILRTKARAAGDADIDVLIEYLAHSR